MPKMPQFEIKAHAVTAKESNSDGFSDWAEIRLDIQYGSHVRQLELTRAAGEEILRQLHKVLHPWAGHSVTETVQAELDAVVGRLLDNGAPELRAVGTVAQKEWREHGEERGKAQGLAFALAYLRNPYKPNVDAIRKEAVARVRGEEE